MPIRNHVPSSGNVFADLGLPKIDAISLRARRRQFLESIRPNFRAQAGQAVRILD